MNESRNQTHFDNISKKYQRAADTWSMIYESVRQRLDPIVEGKEVLDVGNGGQFAYDTDLAEKVTAMDIASHMMDGITDPKIAKIVGDARNMDIIEDESCDAIVFLLVLHHINGTNVDASLDTLRSVVSASFRKLRPGGYLIVTEALLSGFLYRLQSMAFQIMQFILGRFGVSMIFFFTLPIMRKALASEFKVSPESIEVIPLKLEGWLDPLGGSFPGLIKIPASVQPWDFTLLIVQKEAEETAP